jgi:hypothetical protein
MGPIKPAAYGIFGPPVGLVPEIVEETFQIVA